MVMSDSMMMDEALQVKDRILMFIHFHFTGPMLSFVDYPELADHGAPCLPSNRVRIALLQEAGF
jgi:hypothetical protein